MEYIVYFHVIFVDLKVSEQVSELVCCYSSHFSYIAINIYMRIKIRDDNIVYSFVFANRLTVIFSDRFSDYCRRYFEITLQRENTDIFTLIYCNNPRFNYSSFGTFCTTTSIWKSKRKKPSLLFSLISTPVTQSPAFYHDLKFEPNREQS